MLYETVNTEFKKVEELFRFNKLSLNISKTKYTLFFKPSKRNDLPLKLPKIVVNNIDIKRENHIKFLGVLLDENLSWKTHISAIENKVSRNLGILRKAKPYLNLKSLKSLYFSFIHSYLTYCNIAWASTNQTKLKKLYSKQKLACRIILGIDRFTPSNSLLAELNILSIYKLNIHQVLSFMFKSKLLLNPKIFNEKFSQIQHKYNTRYSKNNFETPKTVLKSGRYSIQHRGPWLWNTYLKSEYKNLTSLNIFKTTTKKILLCDNNDNILFFF